MKSYKVVFERDSAKWWVASVRGVPGVHSQGRSIEEARRRVREALALAIGDDAATRAELVDDVRVPKAVRLKLVALTKALAREETARLEARKAAVVATKLLTERLHLSRRDAAALTGYSFQRIQQLVEGL